MLFRMGGFVFDSDHPKGLKLGDGGEKINIFNNSFYGLKFSTRGFSRVLFQMGGFVFNFETSKGLKLRYGGEKYKFSIIDSTARNLVSAGYRGCTFEWEGLF